eukprot:93193-Rhodomonas_salina.2
MFDHSDSSEVSEGEHVRLTREQSSVEYNCKCFGSVVVGTVNSQLLGSLSSPLPSALQQVPLSQRA